MLRNKLIEIHKAAYPDIQDIRQHENAVDATLELFTREVLPEVLAAYENKRERECSTSAT